ncbi:MAG TPA: TIGR03571 family LLM class oxidoreductase [Ensifer sp.]|jgi:luciferase-type oxidoreductase|uniref:TIGR03571 family LLM class oxidoreductase n=1 Tax=Ensifer sp. TaxID=1872086 RepID=UPI002E0EC6A2|nr:TIGR03571 family LLM class oxidoreductase [Ensifer sp.]
MAETSYTSPDVAGRVFSDGALSIGLSLPLMKADETVANVRQQLDLAKLADALGFRALWVRDVPLNSVDYPDPVGHLDPWAFLGALSTQTERIALGTGAIVLTLRHPLHIAKAAVSVSALSQGRLLLGLGSGDRPGEYAAFGKNTEERRALFQRNWQTVAAAVGLPSQVLPDLATPGAPDFLLLPVTTSDIPLLAVGSGSQSVNWIARHALGWMTYHREPEGQRARYAMWREAVARDAAGAFRAFGVTTKLDLSADPNEGATVLPLGYRVGRRALLDLLKSMRDSGTHHVSFALSATGRDLRDVMTELGSEVLPVFHAP